MMAAQDTLYVINAMLIIVNGLPLQTPSPHETVLTMQAPAKRGVLSTVKTSDWQEQAGLENRPTSVATIHNEDPTTEDHNVSSGQKTAAAAKLQTSISSSHDLGKRMRRGSDPEEKLEKEILLELFALRLKYDKFFTDDMDVGLLSIVDSVDRQLHDSSSGSGSHADSKDVRQGLKTFQNFNLTPVLTTAAVKEQSGNLSTNNTLEKQRIKDIQGDFHDPIMVKANSDWPQVTPIAKVQSTSDYRKAHMSTAEQQAVEQKLNMTSLHTSSTTFTHISTHSKIDNKISTRVGNSVPETNPNSNPIQVPFSSSHISEPPNVRTTTSQNEIGGESVNRESQILAEDLRSLSHAVNNFDKQLIPHEMLTATTDNVTVTEATSHNRSVVGVVGDVKTFGHYPNKIDHEEDEFHNLAKNSTRQKKLLPFGERQRTDSEHHSVPDYSVEAGNGQQILSGETDMLTHTTSDEFQVSFGKDGATRLSTHAEESLPLEKGFVDENYPDLQKFTESWNYEVAHQGSAAQQNDHQVLASYKEFIEWRLLLHRVFINQQEKEREAWCSFVQSILGDNTTVEPQNVLSVFKDKLSVPEEMLSELRNSLFKCQNDLSKPAPVSPYFEGNKLKDLALSMQKLRKIKRFVLCHEKIKCPNTETPVKGKSTMGIHKESPAGLLDRILSNQYPLIGLQQDSKPTEATRSGVSGTDNFPRARKQLAIQDTSARDKGGQTAELFNLSSNSTKTVLESDSSIDIELYENMIITEKISTKQMPKALGAETTPVFVADNMGKATEWSASKALAKSLPIHPRPTSLTADQGENSSISRSYGDIIPIFPHGAADRRDVFNRSNPLGRTPDVSSTNPASYSNVPDNDTLEDLSLPVANRSHLPSAEAVASGETGGQLMRRFHVILYVSVLAVGIALLTAGMCVKHRVHPAFGAHPRKVKPVANRVRVDTKPARPAEYYGSCRAYLGRPAPSCLAPGEEEENSNGSSNNHNSVKDDSGDGEERSPLLFMSDVSGSAEAADSGDVSLRSSPGV